MTTTTPTSADATASSWQESLTELSSLLLQSSNGSKAETTAIEKICLHVLNNKDDIPPRNVIAIIQTIHLRTLIKLGRYSAVIDYCRSSSSSNENNNVEEVAYCLYRLKKYDQCRKLCSSVIPLNDNGGGGSNSQRRRGLMHIYAQTLYRLSETKNVDVIYHALLATNNNNNDDNDDPACMDLDERDDTLSNALANLIANYTSSSSGSSSGVDEKKWLEENEILKELLTLYGQCSPSSTATNEEEDEMLQNYDLAYNYATYLLLSSHSRSTSNGIVKAKYLLEHAEQSATTIFTSSSNSSSSDANVKKEEDEEDEASKKLQKQQQLVAERESNPIRANLALSKLLLQGSTNETEAYRTYLTLLTKNANEKSNLMAVVSNNLAFMRDGKESLFDVVKRVPVTSSLSVSEESGGGGGGKGGKDKGASSSTAAVPLVGATPQQVRIALYNRALLYAKMKNVRGCLDTLNVLRSSLNVSYHGDVDNGENTKKEGSPKRNKGKKKRGTTTANTSSSMDDIPTAKPASNPEIIAWEARADLLESELYRISESKDKSYEDILNGAIDKLDKAMSDIGDDDTSGGGVLSFTKSQLLLHKVMVTNPQKSSSKDTQAYINVLESLPSSIKSSPGVYATLASLHTSLSNTSDDDDGSSSPSVQQQELLSSLGESIPAKLAMAEFKMDKGQYNDAVELLQGIVDNDDDDSSLEATALLVKALSYVDPSKAEEYVEVLQDAMEGVGGGGGVSSDTMDGEALESMDIPRFAKKDVSTSSSSTKVRKLIAATGGGKGRSNMGERKKTNREAILRKRAKQREAYLARLESEGRYDPNKPSPKPDPERWIPKSQRSYNRRGRGRGGGGGRYKSNVGAQGGGVADAGKLDVAARVAAKASGGDGSGSKPSTANIKVSSSGATRKGKGGKRR